ncbi:unnamed protein product [Closterium sp. NIES-64]|nr:unnamed protein product [Closterium sp. NIES-64]
MLRDARTPPKSWSDFEPPTARWANPFALRVGQVFTGFGVGCGVGIGVGRPVNLGKGTGVASGVGRIGLGPIGVGHIGVGRIGVGHIGVGAHWVRARRGRTLSLSPLGFLPAAAAAPWRASPAAGAVASMAGALPGAGAVASMAGDFNRLAAGAAAPLRPLLRRMGVPHVDVGVGCGVGFGHGFGAGVALKPQVLASLLQSAQAVASRLISHIPQEHRSHATAALSSSIPAISNSIPALTGAAEKSREGHNVAVGVVGSERVASESYPGALGTDSGASGTYVGALGTSSDSPLAAANRAGSTGNSGAGGAYVPDVDQAKAQNLIMLSLLEQQADIRRLTQQVQALQEQQHQEVDRTRCFDCRRKSRRRTKSGN